MLTLTQAIILGLIQGVTELFPISSLGHSIIIPQLLGWNIDQGSSFFLIFLVATHLATALVLIGFFFTDWIKIVIGVARSLVNWRLIRSDVYAKLGWLIIIATIPAGLLGVLLQRRIGALFAAPDLVALFLIGNGLLLYFLEQFKKSSRAESSGGDHVIARLSFWQSFKIGIAQALALIPGFSRTGSALGGGLLTGLNHEDAARFSFLLATPIILAAGALKLPSLIKDHSHLNIILAGAITSAIAAFFSVKFLTKYFKNHSLKPFAYYCMAAGIISFLIFLFQ